METVADLVVIMLCRHLDFFEIVRMEDERQLAKKFETVRLLLIALTNHC